MSWKDRVKEFRRVPVAELQANPKNWREHPKEQQEALSGVLEEVGIAGALLARETPDGLELIDGHLRSEMNQEVDWPVLVLDVNEEEADKLLASIDPIAAMALKNESSLNDLLAGIEAENASFAKLLKGLETKIPEAPDDFSDFDEDIETQHECPSCGYRWSGGE